MRRRCSNTIALSLLLAACGGAPPPAPRPVPAPPAAMSKSGMTPAEAGELLGALADDSMEGRGTATPGGDRAARLIAERMRAYGLAPAGDSGYFQRVPLVAVVGRNGTRRLGLATTTATPEGMARGINVVGIVRGSDPALRDQAVLIDAHYDHLGIGPPVDGDSIYNGADDDASGVVAVLERRARDRRRARRRSAR